MSAAVKVAPRARMQGADGREYVSINTSTHGVFARACIDEWQRQDRTSRHYLLKNKAVTVPVDVLAGARRALEAAGKRNDIPEGEDGDE